MCLDQRERLLKSHCYESGFDLGNRFLNLGDALALLYPCSLFFIRYIHQMHLVFELLNAFRLLSLVDMQCLLLFRHQFLCCRVPIVNLCLDGASRSVLVLFHFAAGEEKCELLADCAYGRDS